MSSPIVVNQNALNNQAFNGQNIPDDLPEELRPRSGDFLDPMFSVPILHLEVRNWEKKKEELLRLYENTKSNALTKTFRDVHTDYHYNGENPNSCYSQEVYRILESEILIANSQFIPEAENPQEQCNLGMENSWFESASSKSFHQVHNHGPTGISAVCYIEFDKEVHEPTHFLNPFLSHYLGSDCYYAPWGAGEGSILFWPSPILHYTQPNESEKDRLVLSFNLSLFGPDGLKRATV